MPTYFGSNHYTIDSDFGVFEADGNQMLMRRVAEINAIAKLQAMSQIRKFTQAAAQTAQAPLQVRRIWLPIQCPRSPAFQEASGVSSIEQERQ